MTELFIPPVAQKMADDLTKDTGVAPTLRKYVGGLLLEHSNEHVALTIYYRLRSSGWKWTGSTLIIDGEKQALLAHGYKDYVEIFKLGRRQRAEDFATVVETPSYPATDEDTAPAAVLKELAEQRKAAVSTGRGRDTVHLLRDDDQYVVHIDCGPIQFWLHMAETNGEWKPVYDDRVIAVMERDGVTYDVGDKLLELGGDIIKLLAVLGHQVPDTNIPQSIHHAAEPKRLNSVEVRRTTVIRV